ncbi:putative cation-transporting P-type ATPase [Thauera linaloolentis 47Lol = DSM 12138]|uniref:Putative cation-transporting P-type ATPase n=1 Tax=Thauera linaloolentis (strain DSM 12138 / JCM 21573 / CCUG 41526 / CIP 105981 / IAM 15112 / NBRC 102519 / 47Lol) TaxID=1123367 RepID=N6Y5A3_THAL4|nr:putative cation-transporting P-type ATPase [Thauera linaloolentis 47Lol = DSM 12138]
MRHGPNTLPEPPRNGPLKRFLLQFHNVLIYVLLAAGVVTLLLGHHVDSGVIFGVVLINALIGFLQEGKAERALDAIRDMLSPHAQVLRDGRRQEVDAGELVPGDIVFLASGDKVPADLRLIDVRSLRIDEAVLTGEAQPVEKSPDAVAIDTSLGDRRSMAYSGTLVTYGQGSGVVVATGAGTEIGRISAMLDAVEPMSTPLLRQVAAFSAMLTWVILGVAVGAFAFGTLLRGYAPGDMFLAAVGLAVAAIPEGLPAIMTITLAIGVQRMARRRAIIRRLPAVEALGSVTVICSDKTGTLTRNEMTVQRVITADGSLAVSGAGYAPHGGFESGGHGLQPEDAPLLRQVGRAALLCNDAGLSLQDGAWRVVGDPTEGALLTLALKAGIDPRLQRDELPRDDLIPFESEHCFMATLHHDHRADAWIMLKGAPERVMALCGACAGLDGRARPLDAAAWHGPMGEAAGEGMRLLAVAERRVAGRLDGLRFDDVEQGEFVLLAVLGITDPPRDEAVRAVQACVAAGIRVKMITGDHAATARAIGQLLGLAREVRAVTGAEIERMDDAALAQAVRETEIFARASPEHKLRLVKALQAGGEVVAMTGDGVNDAPALKRADVGVAMGQKGTEAAKEAAEMVLADDNFASVAAAVEEGRTVYDNLKKAFAYILPTNIGQAGIVFFAVLFGLTMPITPAQILWVNMITAVTLALALAFEKAEPDIMQRRPRDPREPLLTPFLLWRILFVGLLLVAGGMGLFLWELGRGASLAAARTVAVNAVLAGEVFYLFNMRSLTGPVLNRAGLLGNRYVLWAIGLLLVCQALFTYLPAMQALFGTAGLAPDAWLRILGFGVAVLLLVEAEKAVVRRMIRGSR